MDFHALILLLQFVSVVLADYSKVTSDVKLINRRLRAMEDNIAEERIQRREDVQSVLDKLTELQNTIQASYVTGERTKNEYDVEKRAKTVIGQITHAFAKEKLANLKLRREIQHHLQELSSGISGKLETHLEDITKVSVKLKDDLREMEQYITAATEGIVQNTIENLQVQLQGIEKMTVKLTDDSNQIKHNIAVTEDAECLANLVDKSKREFSSCMELKYAGFTKSGVYKIKIKDRYLQVYCDQTTDGGGWIVFQRRKDGSVDFYRTWSEYKHGFGDLEGEFWLGNDNLADLTETCCHDLRVDLGDVDGNTRYAKYSEFRVLDEGSLYELNIGTYSGNAGDSLTGHNEKKFSTKDSDNDLAEDNNCAVGYVGAWWFSRCYHAHLNGPYKPDGIAAEREGYINWVKWKDERDEGGYHALTFSEMKFR